MPKKVCFQIIGAKGSGGAEAFYVRFVKALSQQMDVHCIVRKNSWAESQLKGANVTLHALNFGGVFDFVTKFKIKSLSCKLKPVFVQVWMSRAAKNLPKLDVPTVGRMGGYYKLKYYKNCDYLAGNTEDICRYMIEAGHPQNKTHYLPNFPAVPAEGWDEKRESMRAELGIASDAKVLFAAGRLHVVKGFDVLIDALTHLPDNTHLILVGSGGLEEELKSQAKTLGLEKRVHFLGWQNAISPFVAASDIWVAPSRYEPLGNIVLEAWAHKRPVVAGRSKGPESLITHDETGLLFDIDDVAGCAAQIQRVLNDENVSENLSAAGYNHLMAHFSEEAIMKTYMEFYQKICAE